MTTRRATPKAIAALGALLLAGCPGLETPVTIVDGTIVGASAGAYAYPLGRPDLKAQVTLPAGTWRIEGVPTSVTEVVLFDGADRAERVAVALHGGAEYRVGDRYGSGAAVGDALRMPLAGQIVVAARPEGGAVPWGTAYTVEGTDLEGIVQATGTESITLGPLPAGRYAILTHRDGFVSELASVDAVSGATVPVSVRLPIDPESAQAGCAAGDECEHGLHCSPVDGRCYACVSAGDCGGGEVCDTASGLCRSSGAPSTAVCSACTSDADCTSGVCVVPAGSPGGYCSLPCAATPDCPAGFGCATDGRCVAPSGCADWLQTMASACVSDGDCTEGLAAGTCLHPPDAPGYCTASCSVDAQCRIGTGTASTMTCTANLCAP